MEEKDAATEPRGVAVEQEDAGNVQDITTSALSDLQHEDSRKIMDVVDRLRRGGLSEVVQLPQLVVCGDQSSRKSSVLEAITEIPFPRKENLCTRFATEIVLRRATTASITTKIIPDKSRAPDDKAKLEAFNKTIKNFADLPSLIEHATDLVGLSTGRGGERKGPALSRDVLSIEIEGPNRPHLTVVDLPGLIHSASNAASEADVKLIRSIVYDYIKEGRTIIMAVVSAKNDYANQIILQKCREVETEGHRTIGIITKPDFLIAGSDNEVDWLDLARNRDVHLGLGWHMLKNRTPTEMSNDFEARNASEASFFSTGRYREMPADTLGIKPLRVRLSRLLYKHLKTELPALRKEINEKHRGVCHELKLLGEKRSTAQERRRFLMDISMKYQDIAKAATNGQYEHDFFGQVDVEQRVDDETNMRRVRATVQYLNLQYATAMREYGHAIRIETENAGATGTNVDGNVAPDLDDGYGEFAELQQKIAREDEVARVRQLLVRSRGRELPGTFNPLLISQPFWSQSSNWETIASYHIARVAEVCATSMRAAIEFAAPSDGSKRLQALKIDNALENRLKDAKFELRRLVKDTKQHPITYDPSYTSIVQKARMEKHTSKFNSLVKEAETEVHTGGKIPSSTLYPKSEIIKSGIVDIVEKDMDKTSAEDALDSQFAYYKKEVSYFIDAVTKQVVERHLLRGLAENTLSPLLISDMTDGEISLVAPEPEEMTRQRDFLEARRSMLEQGQETFKSALGLFR
ncbi:hypothetical protein LTR37_002226 [Vermiconidia calcicola]|uniref:Uncharacterized protein n=1 Tax=Vermiconidia calcicola TaxID=1690605 RepID=A0ACC3NTE4_9PEZI|nr:hypothetical protein LTR37_002226 [Vermiconidia calcicola]